MERRNLPEQENKLFLLYIFHKIGAMTNVQAMRFMSENALMDYLDLQLSLAELTDSELMQVLLIDDVRYYTLTSRGQQILAFFTRQIPMSRREHIDQVADHWRRTFHRERTTTADYAKNAAGDYTVRLTEREAGAVLVDVTLNIASLTHAQRLCARWEERSAKAYEALVETLLRDDIAEDAKEK